MDTFRHLSTARAAAHVAAALALAFAPLPAAAQDAVIGDLPALRAEALAEANADRRENGLAALVPGETLDAIAQDHARDMLARDYFAHASPDGDTVGDRFHAAGGARSEIVAENLGSCTGCPIPPGEARVAAFQEGWMESPGHRENLLRRGIDRFGFSIAADPQSGRTVAVQTFAGPGVPRGLAAGETAEALAPAQQVDAARAAVNARRGEADVGALEAAPALSEAARALLPEDGGAGEPPDLDLAAALPEGARRGLGAIALLAASCTGCGAEPTAADIEEFIAQWARSRADTLADPAFDRLGFAMGADGAGAKTAVLVLGAAR